MTCHADAVSSIRVDGFVKWQCGACGKVNDRYIHIGNTEYDGKWWLDDQQELWNESACVFVRNPNGQYLFFERIAYPLGYTVPAGHVDNGEEGEHAAIRELKEEVGLDAKRFKLITVTDIIGDKCVGGSDAHKWHVYREDLDSLFDVQVLEEDEGRHPVWMTIQEAEKKELPFAIRYLLDNFGDQIDA